MKNNKPTTNLRHLGGTDIQVTPIGLGVMQFSGSAGIFRFVFPEMPQEKMNEIVATAFQMGVNWFDTAELYGNGRSERGLARGLKAAGITNDEVVVATKWFPILRTASNISRTIEDRIRFLEGYHIDLYMVHQPWGLSPPEAEMDAMADLVEAGKIHSVGVSNFNQVRMKRAYAALKKRGLTLAVNQVQYSLLNRKIETNGVLDTAKDLGVTIVAWSPLARGLLTGKFHKDPKNLQETPFGRRMMLRRELETSRAIIKALEEIAEEHNATPAQIALNWVINAHGELVVAIPGASKVQHAQENAGAMNFKLTESEITRLDELSRPFR